MDSASRRLFLARAGGMVGAGLITAVLRPEASAGVSPLVQAAGGVPLDELARDEDFWSEIQRAFAVDRSLIYLNNGGSSPAPGVAMDALRRYDEYSNQAPTKTMWRDLKPEYETVRERLALCFGCSAEEIAITRNATESLNNLIFGLELEAGDEVLTTEHDYGSMLAALHQRELREGIKVVKLVVPTPVASKGELVDLFRSGITAKTRAILISHVCYLNGQIFPIRAVTDMARPLGIEVIVDGAHSFAHFPFQRDDLQCDYFGTSLHKWMCAPIGAGMLYVRKEKIAQVWPLLGLGDPRSDDIRKFELIGTHPAGHRLAVSEAVALHESIGAERKAVRLRYLRDRWAQRFVDDSRVTFHAKLNDADSCAIATAGVAGTAPGELASTLQRKHRIICTTIDQAGVCGIRISPSIYTTVREVDIFADAFAHVVEHGV